MSHLQRINYKLGYQIKEKENSKKFLIFSTSENFHFRKLKLFAMTKGILTTIIKENNHFLHVSKPMKFYENLLQ